MLLAPSKLFYGHARVRVGKVFFELKDKEFCPSLILPNTNEFVQANLFIERNAGLFELIVQGRSGKIGDLAGLEGVSLGVTHQILKITTF